MLRRTLNLGILAHVDAGKTTLTERLLFAAGVIDEIGSVDKGTTQTDSLPLEQRRGITIKSAVVAFSLDDLAVNLIDTPGHPDFIAEVERVLGVLDGAVLVVSAVEGVQPQTRILMRALQRLGIPTLLFVNKIDRVGSSCDRTLASITERLTPAAIAMTTAGAEGTRDAVVTPFPDDDPRFRSRLLELLAEHDDELLAAYVDNESLSPQDLRSALAGQTSRALVHPVFCGSAITGAGVDGLLDGLKRLLPTTAGDAEGPLSASVFKIERAPEGEKIAYARVFSGSVQTRDRVRFGGDRQAKVTAISVFHEGGAVQRPAARAGEIAKLWGLKEIRIGDAIGEVSGRTVQREFPPPTLESVVAPLDPGDAERLRGALVQLAEQDPLIDVRQDDSRQELSISLYGEVQKEVVEATLADDFGIEVAFRETTPLYVERPTGTGEAVEILNAETNPHNAEIGFRVEPDLEGAGIGFRLELDTRTIPLYLYKTQDSFIAHMAEYVRESLRAGLFGWQVSDCVVTMTECAYPLADGPPSRRGQMSTAADFRKLTPLVLRQALEHAGTVVCQPTVRAVVEVPTAAVGAVLAALARLGAEFEPPELAGELATIDAVMPAARADDLQRELSGLTGGEGVLESSFHGYQPVAGEQPVRRAPR